LVDLGRQVVGAAVVGVDLLASGGWQHAYAIGVLFLDITTPMAYI
jgi:hypothetical protein